MRFDHIHQGFRSLFGLDRRAGEEKFRKIFHISPVAILISSIKDGRLIDANEAYWKLTGHDQKSAIGRTTVELGIWSSDSERAKFVEKLRKRKSLHNPSYEFTNKRGEKRTTLAYYELIELGNDATILSMFYDVTDQRTTQQALQYSEARTRALLEAIPDMIFEFNRGGTILQFIPSSTLDPLVPPEEFLGKNIDQFMPPVVVEQTMFAIQRSLDSGQLNVFEYQLPQDNENKYFEARLIASGPDTVIAMVRDVTLRKWVEAEHEKLIDELEAKNAELERFTYTVSHDLKSPLITISGFLGFLREDTRSGNITRLDADIQRISDATEKMKRLLNDLLELSRVGRLISKPNEITFNSLVAEALELVHGRISQRGIVVTVGENLPSIFGDHQRLLEVVQNLVDNAAKFMGDQPDPRIEIGQRGVIDDMPVFYVQDNGIGIPPEFKENIFGLFNKLDPRSEGTGIGLALVKRIIEFHGGRIWVESELGKGASFYFSLPLSGTIPTQPQPAR